MHYATLEAPMHLRDYQVAAVSGALSGHRRTCIVAPTGAGKTVIGLECVRAFPTALWCVHTKELVQQSARVLREAFGELAVGIIQAGEPASPFAEYQVASIQTLVSRGYRPPADLLILDECHHYAADEYRQIADCYPRIIGLTATPERSDGRPLGDIFGGLVVAAQYPNLVEQGHLVSAKVFRPDECLSSDLAADPVKAYMKHGEGKQGFVFCRDVPHAEQVAEKFRKAGIPCEVIEAETPADVRADRLESFKVGEIRLLANVYCLTEGIDVPRAKVCLLCRGVTHVSPYLQMVGRVLRPYPGEEYAILIDLPGATWKHGLPTEAREYSLEGSGIKRSSISLTVCLKCGMTCVALPCPRCKYAGEKRDVKPPKIWNVELREVFAGRDTPQNAKDAELKRLIDVATRRGFAMGFVVQEYTRLFGEAPAGLTYADEGQRRREFDRLSAMAEKKKYKDGWVAHRFRAVFGNFPPKGWHADYLRRREGNDEAGDGRAVQQDSGVAAD